MTIRFDSEETGPGFEVRRYDLSDDLAAPEVTPSGFLRTQGRITRVGVFEYRRADGSKISELRPPEEVFSEDSLRSFDLVPLTIDHPVDGVSPETVRALAVGVVAGPRRDSDHVRADVMIHSADAMKAAREGASQISLGYDATVYNRSGTWIGPDGAAVRFDSVQTKIRGNHAALVTRGRAGPTVALRLDVADAIGQGLSQKPQKAEPEDRKLAKKITIGDKSIELEDAIAGEVESAFSSATKATETERARADKAEGELEASKAELAKLQAERKADAAKPDLAPLLAERLELAALAAPVLKKPLAEVAKMDGAEIILATVKAAHPDLDQAKRFDGRSPDYLRAFFDRVTVIDTSAALRLAIGDNNHQAPKNVIAEAEARARAELTERWKTTKA